MAFKKKSKTIAIFDIGSASVGCAIASFDTMHNSKNLRNCPEISYTNRQSAQIVPGSNFKSFIKEILSTMDRVATEIPKQKEPITEVAVFLPSPFYVSHTNIVKKNDKETFVVSNKMLHDFLSKQAENVKKQYPTLYPDLVDDETVVLENKIMQIRLNGYETNKPQGKQAQDLFMATYTSVGSQKVIDRLTEIIIRNLGTKKVSFHSFALSAFSTFRDLTPIKSSFLLLDVTGELTDISVVTDGYISENASFPLGKNFIIRKISTAMGTTNTEVYSSLKEYLAGNLTENSRAKIDRALDGLKSEWIQNLSEALSSVMQTVLLPETIYTVGDDIICKIFAHWIKDQELIKFSLASQPLSTNLIDAEELSSYCIDKSGQKYDPFFQVEALFCQKFL